MIVSQNHYLNKILDVHPLPLFRFSPVCWWPPAVQPPSLTSLTWTSCSSTGLQQHLNLIVIIITFRLNLIVIIITFRLAYLPASLNTYINDTFEDGKEVAYELYEDIKEEVVAKSEIQVDALTKLLESFVERVMRIRQSAESVSKSTELVDAWPLYVVFASNTVVWLH